MSRLMIVLMMSLFAAGSVWAQGKSGSHGGGPPVSTPTGSSVPPSSGGTPASSSSTGNAGSSSTAAPTVTVTGTTTSTVSTLPSLPPLPSGSGVPSLTPPRPAAATDCASGMAAAGGKADPCTK